MSSPSSVSVNNASACIREGTRVILREITANLQNSPPGTSPRRKSGNEATSIKTDKHQQQHDVKVRFIREFADAATLPIVNDGITETNSLSSASSFQSLASTLSSKCSSGICVDSSPNKNADRSYTNADISGLDDLISACENIRLDETITTPTAATNENRDEQSFVLHLNSEDHSPDQTFTSATDRNSPDRDLNVTTDIASAEDPKIDSHPIKIVGQLDITREITSENLEKQIDRDLNITTDIETENPPLHSEKEINIKLDTTTKRENSSINEDFHTETEIRRKTLLSHPENEINLGQDSTTQIKTENSPINPDNKINLDKTAEIRSENSLLNPETLDLDKTPEIRPENLPIIPEDQINHELDETTEIRKENSLINPENQINLDLDKTTEIKRDNSPINLENQINLDLDKTTEIKRDNSPINFENQINPDLDGTTEIRTENLSINSENPTNLDFDKTTDVREENLSINRGNLINLNITTEIKRENSPINFENQTNRDLNTSTEIKRDDSPINREIDYQELDLTRTIDEETEASLANDDLYCKFLNSAKSTPSELESTNEKFVQGDSDIAQSSLQNTSEKLTSKSSCVVTELAKTEDSTKALEIPNKEDEELKRYEDHPLESLKPSYTDYHENLKSPEPDPLRINETVNSPLKVTSIIQNEELKIEKSSINETADSPSLPSLSSVCLPSGLNETIDLPPLDLPKISSTSFSVDKKSSSILEKFSALSDLDSISTIQEPTFLKTQTDHSIESRESSDSLRERNIVDTKSSSEANNVDDKESRFHNSDDKQEGNSSDELNSTITFQDTSVDDILTAPEADQYAEFVPQKQSTAIVPQKIENSKSSLVAGAGLIGGQPAISRPITLPDDYSEFVPQRQSTNLAICSANLPERIARQTTPFVTCPTQQPQLSITGNNRKTSPKSIANIDDRCNFAKLELAANSVANDILNTSLELAEENEHFVSAESELFEDQANFDFLLSKTPRKNPRRDLRAESLYVNFDPLVSNTSMLPQSIQNPSPPASEARNGENDTSISKIGTPKRNPAIAAIDRLLFYSPVTANTTPTNANSTITNAVTQNTNDAEEKLKPVEETSAETINMAKELELVRTTVLQLEEQLEKLTIDHEEALEKQTSYKEKINQLQAQLAQEIKNKNEITVVVDEYEISISRLVAERERDRKNLDLEKAKLQEELAETKHHLDNTEAAFNDVHLKYERLKGVVATYRNNEIALKESLEENVEIIKSLENRYEQVKSHATARLEKANLDLDAIRKQNESETVRLNAMLRKAELKSNSLAELVEQKTKENNQLTQILDEVIARVGRNKSE